jgi:LmbE family N-acetylglucosaminyl deacetylase
MLRFSPLLPKDRAPRLLFLGAHSDDIEIGCGGAALRLLADHPGAAVRWVVFGCNQQRAPEARGSAAEFLERASAPDVATLDFPDAFFPSRTPDIKRHFESLKAFDPDIIFTHCGHDLHQDHRVLSELTWNTFRNHPILEYEVAKYDADLRSPNVFITLSAEQVGRKIALLMKHFATQRSKHWFDEEVFRGLMRIRGLECCSPSGYAEGFHARKIVL